MKEKLRQYQQEIAGLFPEEISQAIFKWVKPENLHITLLFVGEVKDENLLDIIERTKKAAEDISPFQLNLGEVCYDNKKAPRLVWLKLAKNEQLSQIAENLGNFDFSPHITLARIRTWQWKYINPEEQPEININIEEEILVSSLDIMESVLKRSGPEYIALQKILLK